MTNWPDYVEAPDPKPARVTNVVELVDKEFGPFYASVRDVYRGRNLHPLRAQKLGRKAKKLTAAAVASRLPPHVKLEEASFVDGESKATFVDEEFGEWEALVSQVLKGSGHPNKAVLDRKETCKEKYGVSHPLQHRDFQVKAAKRAKRSWTTKHWRTGAEVVTVGSYEKAVVSWLNAERIDYEWQVSFKLRDGSLYFVDLHIIPTDTFVEIKGRWRLDGDRAKWDEFCESHPTAELWGERKLTQMSLIPKRKRASK